MDRKSITVLIVCFVLLFAWPQIVNRIFPPKPVRTTTNLTEEVAASNVIRRTTPPAPSSEDTAPSIGMPQGRQDIWMEPETEEEIVRLETDDSLYLFTSHGGGIKRVDLKNYPKVAGRIRKGNPDKDESASLNALARVPALTLFGGQTLADGGPFQLDSDGESVRAERVLTNGLRVIKDFRPGTNFTMAVAVRVENTSTQAIGLPLSELVVGTATPINPKEELRFLGVQWFNGDKSKFVGEGYFANRTLGCLPGTPRFEYLSPGASNVVWAAVHNQFFTMIAAPQTNALGMVARRVTLPPLTPVEREAYPKAPETRAGFQTALVFPGVTLQPGESVAYDLELFAGPKEYNQLARLGKERDLAMNFTRFFGWFSKALLLAMNQLHSLGLPYGLSIIVITVVIKLLFWPLTQASTRSMKRMQALQPQMKALQEKYKEEPQKMNRKLMEFMKENRVSPLGGCFPILLQIPVFIGFYQMLQSAIELRGASFLWARDLSQPDTIFLIPGLGWIPLLGIPGVGFPVNPLPLIMGVTQFWQARMTPTSPGADPMQQKMMQYMPLMFILILYNFSSGLALYWTVNNLLSILQMKLTKTVTATPAAKTGEPATPTTPAKPFRTGRRARRKR